MGRGAGQDGRVGGLERCSYRWVLGQAGQGAERWRTEG